MKPVRRRDLLVLTVGLTLAGWLAVRAGYGALPRLQWWLAIPVGALAVAEALTARVVRDRLAALRAARTGRRLVAEESAQPVRGIEPMLVARLGVLAQASAYVGAVVAGLWLGVLLYVVPALGRLAAAGNDTVAAVIGVVCGAGLVAAALWLEAVCRIPSDPSSSGRQLGQEPSP